MHPLSKCNALNVRLEPCKVRYRDHREIMAHSFGKRPDRKSHIPWDMLGQDHAYCGMRPHHFNDPTSMEWIGAKAQPALVKRAARLNLVCTACFKNWLYLLNRAEFIGARKLW